MNIPANYTLEMCESLWLYYDDETQRDDISITHLGLLLKKLDYWERAFVAAHEKALPVDRLMQLIF